MKFERTQNIRVPGSMCEFCREVLVHASELSHDHIPVGVVVVNGSCGVSIKPTEAKSN